MHEELGTNQPKKSLQDRISDRVKSRNTPRSSPLSSLTQSLETIFHNPPRFTAAIQSMFAKPDQDTQLLIAGEHLLGILLIGVVFFARIANLGFNTLNIDEVIYTKVGQNFLSGLFVQQASSWMFASYLYPITAALVNEVAADTGLRVLSAVLITIAAIFVYIIAFQLFDRQSALWALFIFGLAGISISLGQYAVYDALGVPLSAIALYCVVQAVRNKNEQQIYLRWAGIAFSLSVLASYIGLSMLPALLAVMLLLHVYHGRGLVSFISQLHWSAFITPILLILGIYVAFYRMELIEAFRQFSSTPGNRSAIILAISQQIGIPLLLAVVGAAFGFRQSVINLSSKPRGLLLILVIFLPLLITTILILPLYHVFSANPHDMWKHNVYTLILVAPLAGYGLTKLIHYLRSLAGPQRILLRMVGAILTALMLFGFVFESFRQNDAFHHSWPNSKGVIEYIRSSDLPPDTTILASGSPIYEYYFDFEFHDPQLWDGVRRAEPNNLQSLEDAIRRCDFDLGIVNTFYAPELSQILALEFQQAGYAIAFSEVELLATNAEALTNVYVLPNGECRNQAG
jgi:hypothetical protein